MPAVLALVILPFVVPPYQTVLLSYGLVFAIAALGFNLLLGYTGLLSFGHSAYFGVGAYAVAFVVKYLKIDSMEVLLLAGASSARPSWRRCSVCSVSATRRSSSASSPWRCPRSCGASPSSSSGSPGAPTGSGCRRRPCSPARSKIGATAGQDKLDFLSHRYYFYVLAIFVICVALMWVIVHSPFGKALQAVRDNETRAEFVGVQVWHYRWVAFLISGIYTGLAGALWVPLNGLTTPDILHWTFSGKIVFFTVLGGFQTFFGPIVGAVIYNYLETYAVGHTVYWQMVLGIVLVVLVLALPAGIVGTAIRLVPRFRKAAGVVSILKTEQLTKSFGDTHAVDHVDFTVTEGEVLALIGSNGAGKTTLVNLISGLIPADSGRIVLEGTDITAASIHRKIELGIARSFQLVNLFDQLSTLDNVALAIFSRDGKTRKLLSLSESDTAVRDEARGILQSFGLDDKAAMVAGGLSQGERKLLDVAVAYALRPKLLFLDEPTSGVSTREKAPIMDIITSVVRSGGITAVIIEHDMDVVFTYCPRIVAMHQGAILADGTPDEIRNNEQVTANLLGTHRHSSRQAMVAGSVHA